MQTISQLYESSGAAGLGFTEPEFCQLLADVAERSLEASAGRDATAQLHFAGTLRLDELVLAHACARGDVAAWDLFVNRYRDKLYAAASAMTKDTCAGRELADSLYAGLFGSRTRADGRRNSKLESYLGRGSLEGWLRIVLAQEHVNRLRRDRKFAPFDESIRSNLEPAAAASSNLSGLTADHELLAQTTDAALAALPSEERLLLAAYYLDSRTLAEIGRMLNVHESTVSRRLEKITGNLRKQITRRLRSAGLSRREAEELLESDVRDLGVDVRARLTQERQA